MLASLPQDVRYALQGFASRPIFAGVALRTRAVGIRVRIAAFPPGQPE